MFDSGAPDWAIALGYAGGGLFWWWMFDKLDHWRERRRREPPMRNVTPK